MGSKFKEWMEQDDIRIGISELTKKTGTTTRQLRYWEKKGYISSIQPDPNTPRAYKLKDILKVELIKENLDKGYKLATAYEKAIEHLQKIQRFRELFSKYVTDMDIVDERYERFSIGPFVEDDEKIIITHDSLKDKLSYEFISKND